MMGFRHGLVVGLNRNELAHLPRRIVENKILFLNCHSLSSVTGERKQIVFGDSVRETINVWCRQPHTALNTHLLFIDHHTATILKVFGI